MRALVCDRPGSVRVAEVDRPRVADDAVLVRVHASSANVADLFTMTAIAHLSRFRRHEVMGRDFAGVVEEVGRSVRDFQAGDEVFGARRGAMAEYIAVPASGAIAKKPSSTTFEQAAAIPLAATTALQALRDHGRVASGQKVLVNGGSGAVGTFAVQVAAAYGAEVTAVVSTRNVEQARSLGAAAVVDYTRDDFTLRPERYDVLIDIAGSKRWPEYRRVLQPNARFVAVGARVPSNLMSIRFSSVGSSQKYVFFIARMRQGDLVTLRGMVDAGKLRAVVDRTYDLDHAAEAFVYLKAGHAQGKVVVTV